MTIKNTCSPTTVFGPFDQTLFLGVSIMSFSASAGWNDQVSEVTIQLVEDNCVNSGGKKYWDCNLAAQTTTAVDIGFIGLDRWLAADGTQYSGVQRVGADTKVFTGADIIGSPVYFRIGSFEFAGLLQSFEQSNSASGRPTYSVKLVDPRQILEGAQLILGEYAGGVGSVKNLFNPFGAMEIFGTFAQQIKLNGTNASLSNYGLTTDDGSGLGTNEDGAIFGSFPQGFGGALTTNNGIQWSVLLTGINILINSLPRAQALGLGAWSPFGRLLFRGETCTLGYGLMDADVGTSHEYYVDLSELPTMPADWRIEGSNTTLIEVIGAVCDAAGCDYYIELMLVASEDLAPGGIAKFIKIRTADRTAQPDLGIIAQIVGDSSNLVNSTVGQELRNETTSSFIIGGPKNTVYQVEQTFEGDSWNDDAILPFFGLDVNGNAIIPTKDDDGDWIFEAPNAGIDAQLKQVAPFGSTITITEMELRAALSSKDSWVDVSTVLETDIGLKLIAAGYAPVWAPKGILQNIADMAENDFIGRFGVNAALGSWQVPHNQANKEIQEDVQNLFNFVKQFAEDYYGKRFQIRVPYGFAPVMVAGPAYHRLDIESFKVLTSESPRDSGWSEKSTILQAPNAGVGSASAVVESFRREDAKIGSFVRFDDSTTIDKSLINIEDYIIWNGGMFMRCDVESEFVYFDRNTLFSPRIVIELPQQVREEEDDKMQGVNLLFELAIRVLNPANAAKLKVRVNNAIKKVGGKSLFAPLMFKFFQPDAVAVGIESNIMTYGPWWVAGPAGQVRVEHNQGLVPWEFGNYANMNIAADAIATESLTNMQVGEMGSLIVPGYPLFRLGQELGAVDLGGFGGGQSLIETRVALATNYNNTFYNDNPFVSQLQSVNMGGPWTGLFGPNITNIQVSVDSNQIQTAYQMRTYTPKFGRFGKLNADRLSRNGKFSLLAQREIRLWFLQREKFEFGKRQRQHLGARGPGENMANQHGAHIKANTPHEMFVGQLQPMHSGVVTGPDGYKLTVIETLQMKEFGNELEDIGEKAVMGFEGLIRPISMDGEGGLPQYTSMNGGSVQCETTSSEGSQPPVLQQGTSNAEYDNIINIEFLNPWENPDGLEWGGNLYPSRLDTDVGHDMDILGRRLTASGHISMQFQGYDDADKSDYKDDYRGFALRGPLLIQGWGYDLDGKPIPNKADVEDDASQGDFTVVNLQCKFMDNFLRKSNTWPVGPVDLRWDRKRAVWTIPQHRLLVGQLQEDLCAFGSGLVRMTVGDRLWDCDGSSMDPEGADAPEFYVHDKTGKCLPADSFVIAYYDPQVCEYYVLEGEDSLVSGTDICYSSSSFSEITTPFRFKHIELGGGLGGYKQESENCDGCTLYMQVEIAGDNDETCVTGTDVGNGTFHALTVGQGLNLEQAGDCAMRIGVYLGVSEGTGACISDNAGLSGGWNSLSLEGGMYGRVDECELKLASAVSGLNDDECVESGTPSFFNKLIAGGGLNIEQEIDCAARIGVYLEASEGSGACIQDNAGLSGGWNSLSLEGGMYGTINDCVLALSSAMTALPATGTGGLEDCITGTLGDGGGEGGVWNTLMIGKGLSAEVSDCVLKLGVGMEVANSGQSGVRISSLNFTDCFEITGTGTGADPCDGGTATIGLAGTTGGQFDFVSCVYCSGTGIFFDTSTAVFTNCGLFSGVILPDVDNCA